MNICLTNILFTSCSRACSPKLKAQKGDLLERRGQIGKFSNVFHFRQEILFVNLIRKVLMKDFKRCDSTVDVSCIKRNVDNIHNRGCSRKPDAPLPENCILNSVLQAQLLVKNNFSKMDILDSSEPIGCNEESNETILQNYKVGSTALDCSIMITLQRIPPSDEGCDDLK